MTRIFCLALMLLGLAGCGDATTPTQPGYPSITSAAPARAAQNPSDSTNPTPVIPDTNCGEITVNGNPSRAVDANNAGEAIACLVEAFRACRATTLGIQDRTNNLFRQFIVAPGSNGCTLRQALQTDPAAPPAIADCTGARLKNNSLVVESCSHLGDFTLTP